MIIENNSVDLTGVNLLVDDVGGLALSFLNHVTEANAIRLIHGYNLIKVADPDTMLGSMVTDILMDESVELTLQKDTLLRLMLTNIIKLLNGSSVFINTDEVDFPDYDLLYNTLNLFTVIEGIEDLLGLSLILENQSVPPLERFIQLYSAVYMEEDVSVLDRLYILIKDVSEVTLEALRLSLIMPALDDIIPDVLVARVKANKDLLNKSFVGDYIRSCGSIGSTLPNLLSYFKDDLDRLIDPVYEFKIHYYAALLGIIIISDVNNDSVLEEFSKLTKDTVEDMDLLMEIDKLVDGVVYE